MIVKLPLIIMTGDVSQDDKWMEKSRESLLATVSSVRSNMIS